MNKELLIALEQLEKEKGLSKEMLLETIEAALQTAYRKNFGSNQNVRINIDNESGEFNVFALRDVVEEVEDFTSEIDVIDAKKLDPRYEVGDILEEKVTPKDFGRIAAQTAKQVVVQRFREAERGIIYDEFINRESEIVNGTVQRLAKGTVFVNLGKTEAVLLPSEQIPGETFPQGGRVKSVIIEVKKATKGPQILVSRTHPNFVKRLFEFEVPEIYDGDVEIRGIAREAGSRTKIAVYSPDQNIDPVGACVGQKGQRVQAIVDEICDEKIDIIEWSENPAIFISNALSPSKVVRVEVDAEANAALVVVPDYQLSLAIGKEGQNARLAAKLTGWKIDIKSEAQFMEQRGYDAHEESYDQEEYSEEFNEEYQDEYNEEFDNDYNEDADRDYDEQGEA